MSADPYHFPFADGAFDLVISGSTMEHVQAIWRWVPELADISDPYVHDPEAHGCRPADYPEKLIGHREARQRALDAYRAASP